MDSTPSSGQLSLPASAGQAPHLNKGLFSDYYLKEFVQTLPEWESPEIFADAKRARDELRALLEQIHPENLSEPQIEQEWIKPVLEKLGHHFKVQLNLRVREGHKTPDYLLLATADEARAITNQIYRPQEINHSLGLAEAKKWGVNLDQSSRTERNPSQQIDEYLRYSELKWGILTDGRYWRLYERDSSKDNVYYAVDLPMLLEGNGMEDVHHFYYFYLFFRREAFTKGGWLDKVLAGSIDHAEGLSDQLEDEVYEALELIAQGFLTRRSNRLNPDAATLNVIYEQSLILLYRLLFLFYAESRDVLPMSANPLYAENLSLDFIKKRAVENYLGRESRRLELRRENTELYSFLSDLFYFIDIGSADYDLTAYDGRLFASDEHPFLTEKKVGDYYMALALDKLARVPDPNDARKRVYVDYRDLSVRHLGAIYEKLLEYQLDVASEPLAVRDGKYVPAREGDAVIKQPGEVYLRTGNNERKITGSYYTPDYIVGFIVRETLEPLLTEMSERYGSRNADGSWLIQDRERARRAILGLNILDPATGSGHFMVESVAYVAAWLRELQLEPQDLDPDEDELSYWKRQVVSNCIYGVDVNPLAVELSRLSLWLTTLSRGRPLSFLDHHVKLGNTLVGARAVEIGTTLTPQTQPHPPAPSPLRREGEKEPSPLAPLPQGEGNKTVQMALFDEALFAETVRDAVGKMTAIEGTDATHLEQVKEQARAYTELQGELANWRRLANVWTARHFGLTVTPEQWRAVYAYLVKGDPHPPTPSRTQHAASLQGGEGEMSAEVAEILRQAEALAEQYHFLHIDLAFPEVFFDAQGRPLMEAGFDAVVGNPPYVRQERIQPFKPYLGTHYQVNHGTADLFLYFYERGLRLLKKERRLGYITSGTYMNSNSAVAFRNYIHENASFEAVVDFGAVQPFKGVDLATNAMIAIMRKGKGKETFRTLLIEGRRAPNSLSDAMREMGFETPSGMTANSEWRFQPIEVIQLFGKVTQGYGALDEVVQGHIYRGVVTGLNEVFIIGEKTRKHLVDEHESSAEIIKPILRGEDMRPWYQLNSHEYLIFTRRGIQIDNYPAVKRYLEQYRNLLEPKPLDWEERRQGRWQGRKAGSYLWYEIQDNIAYYREFEKPKIYWSEIAKFPRFSWDDNGLYANNKAYFLIPDGKHLLGYLNSRVAWFVISHIATPLNIREGLWRYELFEQFIKRLPIPELSAGQESGLAELAEEMTALARARYQFHEAMRYRIASDLGGGGKLSERLHEWWNLDMNTFRSEVRRVFRADIPVAQRDEWEKYLLDQQAKHAQMTGQMVAREEQLNAIVYEAFKLTAAEIALVEQATKYRYGEV